MTGHTILGGFSLILFFLLIVQIHPPWWVDMALYATAVALFLAFESRAPSRRSELR